MRFADPRTDAAPAIWARGLRNPWRFSFDRVTGDVWIGDVGELTQEEIDHVPFSSAAGRNYGWPGCEGTLGDCSGFTAPVMTFEHSAGYAALIGGFVVRDPGLPSLAGRYLFGDLAKPTAFSAAVTAPSPRSEPGVPTAGTRSFGEDGCGRIYVAMAGEVRRVTETASATCVPPVSLPGPPGGGEQPPPGGQNPGADTTRPAVTVKRGTRSVRVFVLKLRADEAARAKVSAPRLPLAQRPARRRRHQEGRGQGAAKDDPQAPRQAPRRPEGPHPGRRHGREHHAPHAEDPAALSRRVP